MINHILLISSIVALVIIFLLCFSSAKRKWAEFHYVKVKYKYFINFFIYDYILEINIWFGYLALFLFFVFLFLFYNWTYFLSVCQPNHIEHPCPNCQFQKVDNHFYDLNHQEKENISYQWVSCPELEKINKLRLF